MFVELGLRVAYSSEADIQAGRRRIRFGLQLSTEVWSCNCEDSASPEEMMDKK